MYINIYIYIYIYINMYIYIYVYVFIYIYIYILTSRNDGDTLGSPTASFSPARSEFVSKAPKAVSKPRESTASARSNSCMAIMVQVRREKTIQLLLQTKLLLQAGSCASSQSSRGKGIGTCTASLVSAELAL